jgi:hypothetical protein
LGKSGAEGGVFVVSAWWNAWQSWSVDCNFFGAENETRFEGFSAQKKDNFFLDLAIPKK